MSLTPTLCPWTTNGLCFTSFLGNSDNTGALEMIGSLLPSGVGWSEPKGTQVLTDQMGGTPWTGSWASASSIVPWGPFSHTLRRPIFYRSTAGPRVPGGLPLPESQGIQHHSNKRGTNTITVLCLRPQEMFQPLWYKKEPPGPSFIFLYLYVKVPFTFIYK